MSDRTRTFLKGAGWFTLFLCLCTIRWYAGSSRSDSIENIVASARQIAKGGVKRSLSRVSIRATLLQNGVRTERFLDLVKAIDEVDGIHRFRISSVEPNLLTTKS